MAILGSLKFHKNAGKMKIFILFIVGYSFRSVAVAIDILDPKHQRQVKWGEKIKQTHHKNSVHGVHSFHTQNKNTIPGVERCISRNISYSDFIFSNETNVNTAQKSTLATDADVQFHYCDELSRYFNESFMSSCRKDTEFTIGSTIKLFACIQRDMRGFGNFRTIVEELSKTHGELFELLKPTSIVGRAILVESFSIKQHLDVNDDIYSSTALMNPWHINVPINFDSGYSANLHRHTCHVGFVTINDPGWYNFTASLEFLDYDWFGDNATDFVVPLMQELVYKSVSMNDTLLTTASGRPVNAAFSRNGYDEQIVMHTKNISSDHTSRPTLCIDGDKAGRWVQGVWRPYSCNLRYW